MSNSPYLRDQSAGLLEHTTFVLIELFNGDREQIVRKELPTGAAAAAHFEKKGINVPVSGNADGTWIFTNKRLYLLSAIPVWDQRSEAVIGYLKGISQTSLKDMQAIINRFILSLSLSIAAVILCSILTYFGILFLNNHLIRSTKDLVRANTFLLKKLGSALAKSDIGDRWP